MTVKHRLRTSKARIGISLPTAESVGVWRIHLEPEDEPIESNLPDPTRAVAQGRPFLSAAMIVRDEERRLRACLESVRNLVDEIVLVDTGSRDQTRDIARDCGARVFEFSWCDDFAAARNHALERVRGEWVLQIDADEIVRPFGRDALYKRLCDPMIGGYYVRFRRRRRLTRNWQLKLFRRHSALRCAGAVHENIEPRTIRRVTGLKLGECPLEIDHFGYEGTLSAKHARNLPLLLKRLEHNLKAEEAPFLWRHVADIFAALGDDPRAEETGMHAVEMLRAKSHIHPVDVCVYLGVIEHQLKQHRDAGALLEEALTLFPNDLHLMWLQGLTLFQRQLYVEARTQFEKLLSCAGSSDLFGWVGYDRRILKDYPSRCLKICTGSRKLFLTRTSRKRSA